VDLLAEWAKKVQWKQIQVKTSQWDLPELG
jgi:hypothetical protein